MVEDPGLQLVLFLPRGRTFGEVLCAALRTASIGGAIGLGAHCSWLASHQHPLGTRPAGPDRLRRCLVLLLLVAALSALAPALRAARVDPIETLSGE